VYAPELLDPEPPSAPGPVVAPEPDPEVDPDDDPEPDEAPELEVELSLEEPLEDPDADPEADGPVEASSPPAWVADEFGPQAAPAAENASTTATRDRTHATCFMRGSLPGSGA
jgi:hypothetical protein